MVSIILGLAFFVGVCSGQHKSERILDGTQTTVRRYPFIVQVQTLNYPNDPNGEKWEWSCGGSILASNIVISAAHCIYTEMKYHRIRAGATYKNRGGVISSISKILIHPAYTGTFFATSLTDICLIRLKRHLKFGNTIKPIPLISQGREIEVDSIGTYAGWGQTETGETSDVLLRANVRIMSREECEQRYATTIPYDFLCAGYNGTGFCSGDSGGPLIYNRKLVGIVSRSFCTDSQLSVYKPDLAIKLSHYSNWIKRKSKWLQRNYE